MSSGYNLATVSYGYISKFSSEFVGGSNPPQLFSVTYTSGVQNTNPMLDIFDLAYGNGAMVVVGTSNSSSVVYTSTNFTDTSNVLTVGGSNPMNVWFDNGVFVAAANNRPYVYVSSNGYSWNTFTGGAPFYQGLNHIVFFKGRWYFYTNNGVYSTADFVAYTFHINISQMWKFVTDGNTLYASSPSANTNYSTTNGTTWTTSGFTNTVYDCYVGNHWVTYTVNGGTGAVTISINGATYNGSFTLGSGTQLKNFVFSNGFFYGLLNYGDIIKINPTTTTMAYVFKNTSSYPSYQIRNFMYLPFVDGPPTITGAVTTLGVDGFSSNIAVQVTPSTLGTPRETTYLYSVDSGTFVDLSSTVLPLNLPIVLRPGSHSLVLRAKCTIQGTNLWTADSNVFLLSVPCFLEGTCILCQLPDTHAQEYLPVETLRPGDLVVTARSGVVPIRCIGSRTLTNPPLDVDTADRIFCYRTSQPGCEGLFQDLCVTGNHCALLYDVDDATLAQVRKHMGDVFVTEGYYRVPACLDNRATPLDAPHQTMTIWHFALEHDSIYKNYGVYANGLLVESSSIRYMTELSGMQLLQ
jgi:hypothetical protein